MVHAAAVAEPLSDLEDLPVGKQGTRRGEKEEGEEGGAQKEGKGYNKEIEREGGRGMGGAGFLRGGGGGGGGGGVGIAGLFLLLAF